MQFFGAGKRSAVERLLTAGWKSPEERDALISQARDAGLRASEAVPLILSTDAAVRALGSDIFLTRADAAAVGELLDRTQNEAPHIKGFASRVLLRLGPDVAQRAMDGMLADKTAARKKQAWELFAQLSGEWRSRYFDKAMVEAPPALRAPLLQRFVQERGAEALVDTLLPLASDADPRVGGIALEAVSRVKDPRLLELMLNRLAQGDATARELARAWLRSQAEADPEGMRRKMIDLLASGEDSARHACVEIVLATGAPEEVLVDILMFSRNLVGWLRDRILETLRTFGDQVFKPAVTLLTHTDPEVRTAALVLAENFNDIRLLTPLCGMLRDEDWWLRINACDALGRLKDERAVPALVGALEDDEARWAAIDALATIGSASALKPLAGILRDPRPEVRLEVVRAFARFSDARLVSVLAQLREKDPATEVRSRAGEVLRDLQTRLNLPTDEVGASAAPVRNLARPIDRLLATVREQGASDLHITVDEPPFVRRLGVLGRLEGVAPLDATRTREAIFSILSPRQQEELERTGEIDLCHAIPEVGRYRVNAFLQRRGYCASFRVIPNHPPTFADLRIPPRLNELLDYHQGIILVSGPAGCGKSTTLAAVVNLINETKADHVITLEDPIEFVHPVKAALVNQREVGSHTTGFSRALRAALREDPDVIIVGEMRDTETIRLALTAAETGHLVVGTLHTTSAISTVDRLIKSFPPEEQPQVRMALSESLKYVVCQSLLPRKDGMGRVAVFEVLKGTLPVGNLIRENKTYQLPSMMQIGRSVGMQTVDQALLDLVQAGLIAPEAAWRRAEKPENFESLCDPSFLREKGVEA